MELTGSPLLKRCTKCDADKPADRFNARRGECKPCQSEYRRDYGSDNRDRLNEAAAEYRSANADALADKQRQRYAGLSEDERRLLNRKYALQHEYGITVEQYDEMLEAQGGCCAICRVEPGRRPLHVDHDHATGKVRGLLCIRCNTALGTFGDNLEGLMRAVEYLR